MLATLSIRALSILIVVVLNSWFDNLNISIISESGSDTCYVKSTIELYFLPLSISFSFFFFFKVIELHAE